MSSDSNSPPKAEKNNVMRGRDRRDYSIAGYIRRLGWPLVSTLFNLGQATRFALTVIGSSGAALRRPSLIIKQLKVSGVNTLIIILVAGIFVGFVLGLQFYVLLARYGQVEVIGAGVALTLFRELGPVSSGLLFVGCACTSITTSIGLKKASEQIAAMEIMAVDPIARELSPRLWAGFIALPLLTIYFDAVGIIGAYLIAVPQIGIDEGVFWSEMQQRVLFYDDFVLGTLKSLFFGFVATFIAIYEGYFCLPTAEGVANATTRTVIKGSLAVLGFNFVLTAFMVN
jgi:phospholipid/cholesterol/gamma-HCH transport system permease protein